MKICIVSDSHDRAEPLAAAVSKAQAAGAQAVIHCGDLIGANTLRASIKLGVPMHLVHGNNLGDQIAMHKLRAKSGGSLIYHGQDAEIVRQPNIKGGETLLVNPGSVSGIGAPNVNEAYTWILGDLSNMAFEIHTLKHWSCAQPEINKKGIQLALPVMYYSQLTTVVQGGSLKGAGLMAN